MADEVCTVPDCGRPTDSQLCTSHYDQLERTVAELPALYRELEITRTRQDRISQGAAGGKGHEEPLPISLGAMDTAQLAHDTLVSWVRTIVEDDNLDHWPANTVPDMAVWLIAHLGWARRSDEAATFLDEITHLTGKMRRAIDRPEVRWYAGPCGAPIDTGCCEGQMYGRPGKDTLVCDGYAQPHLDLGRRDDDGRVLRGCGATDSALDRRKYLRVSAEDALAPLQLLLDSLEMLAIRPVDRKNAQRWIRQGRLQARGLDLHGVELFRGGDVFALAEDSNLGRGRRWRRAA